MSLFSSSVGCIALVAQPHVHHPGHQPLPSVRVSNPAATSAQPTSTPPPQTPCDPPSSPHAHAPREQQLPRSIPHPHAPLSPNRLAPIPPPTPWPNSYLTCRLTDLNCGHDQAESPGSPTASAPARAEEDFVAGAAPARSDGSTDDAAAVAQKGGCVLGFKGLVGAGLESRSWGFDADQGADKPSSAVAESSKRRKEPEQQQPAAPWAKLLSQCSQVR
jgi:hypothetical protein